MEKEKKPRTTKKSRTTAKLSAPETVEPKKPATRKKATPVAINGKAAEPKMPRKAPPKVNAMNVSHEEIARLAHRYWAERGHQHGHHIEDWLRAERELFGKAS